MAGRPVSVEPVEPVEPVGAGSVAVEPQDERTAPSPERSAATTRAANTVVLARTLTIRLFLASATAAGLGGRRLVRGGGLGCDDRAQAATGAEVPSPDDAENDHRDCDPLLRGETQSHGLVQADEFHEKPRDSGQHRVHKDEWALALETGREHPDQQGEYHQRTGDLVELRGMHPDRRGREAFGERNTPGKVGRYAVVVAAQKAAHPADGIADRDRDGAGIHHRRQPLFRELRDDDDPDDGAEQPPEPY